MKMKITNTKHCSLLFYYILALSLLSFTLCSSMSTFASFKSSVMKAKKHRQSPSLYENWVSYFHYANNTKKIPHAFYTNSEYKPLSKNSEIPTKTSFFAQVTHNKVNFLKNKAFTHIYDTLNIDFIKPIPENNNFLGGVKDLGKFNEGYCFQVATTKPEKEFKMTYEEPSPKNGVNEIWLICLKEEKDKNNMMNSIIKQKLQKQKDLGIELNIGNDISGKEEKQIDEDINEPGLGPNDGYWIVLQDWSQCTLKCGGGKQVKQLQCIPPKKGGKPCSGSSIRERPCNTQPCPEPKLLSQVLGGNQKIENPFKAMNTTNAPVIRMMPISQRPQRYDKCHIKDTDASYLNEKGIKVPIRLVMNNKVISAFQDENLSSALVTFLLEDTQFKLLKGNKACFRLENLNGHADFCSLVESCSGDNKQVSTDGYHSSFVNEWNYDFNLFKTQCFTERDVKKYEVNEDPEFKKKQNELKEEFIQQKINKIKENTNKEEQYHLIKKKKETEAMTMSALMKEKQLEELLLKEEAEREQQELEEIKVQLENEKKKKDCMQKAIKEKELESQVTLSTSEAEREIQKIKEKVQHEIQIKRNEIQQKIKQMRMKNERKKRALLQQIQVIRTETAGHIERVSRKGDINTCKAITSLTDQAQKQDKINEYCTNSLLSAIPDCTTNFCYSCCENEFGELYAKERNECYETLCNSSS